MIYQRNDSMLGPWQLEDVLRYDELGRKSQKYLGIGGARLFNVHKEMVITCEGLSFYNQKGLEKTARGRHRRSKAGLNCDTIIHCLNIWIAPIEVFAWIDEKSIRESFDGMPSIQSESSSASG